MQLDQTIDSPHLECEIHPHGVPEELRKRDQWLVARGGSEDDEREKEPLLPWSATVIEEGLEFTEACRIAADPTIDNRVNNSLHSNETTVVGFMIHQEDPIEFIDWDDVRSLSAGDKSIPEEVLEAIAQIDSYTEISVSGQGLHTLCLENENGIVDEFTTRYKHKIGLDVEAVGDIDSTPDIEAYNEDRYMTVTGTVFTDPRTGNQHDTMKKSDVSLVDAIGHHTVDEKSHSSNPEAKTGHDNSSTHTNSQSIMEISERSAQAWVSYDDGEWVDVEGTPTVAQIRETAKRHGDDEFKRLWSGNNGHYDSASEADLALVSKLWFFTDDPDLVDRTFRDSALYGIRARRDEYDQESPEWDRDIYRKETMRQARDNSDNNYSRGYFTPGGS